MTENNAVKRTHLHCLLNRLQDYPSADWNHSLEGYFEGDPCLNDCHSILSKTINKQYLNSHKTIIIAEQCRTEQSFIKVTCLKHLSTTGLQVTIRNKGAQNTVKIHENISNNKS